MGLSLVECSISVGDYRARPARDRASHIVISGDIHQVFVDNHEIVSQHEIVARLSRIVDPRYPHRVTQRGVRSMNVFYEESDRREYLEMLGEEIARHGVSLLVRCLMTNHVHFVAVPH